MANLRQSQFPWLTDVISTVDNSLTISTACSYVVPNSAAGHVDFTALLKATDLVASVTTRYAFRCTSGGVLTILTAIPIVAIAGDATLFVTSGISAGTSGATFQPKVTGQADGITAITWFLDCKYFIN